MWTFFVLKIIMSRYVKTTVVGLFDFGNCFSNGNGENVDTQNKRYLQVEEKIVDSFNKLMCEKGLLSVKVSDIIREAGINRCSFYTHYRDISDLIEKTEQSIIDDMEKILRDAPVINESGECPPIESVTEHTRHIINYFYENGRVIALYAGDKGDPTFIGKIQKSISDIWSKNPINSALNIPSDYALAGLAGMLSGLFGSWLLNDFRETPDEFLEIVKKMMEGIPANIIDKGERNESK